MHADINTLVLQVRMVGAAHHGAGCHGAKTQLVGDTGVVAEFVRVDKTVHRGMVFAGLQVLADGQHVHIVGTQVLDGVDDLLVGLAQAHHDAALGAHVRTAGLVALQQVQRVLIAGAGANVFVQLRDGLDVVVEHIRGCFHQNIHRGIQAGTEIRGEDFDLGLRGAGANLADALGKMLSTPVGQVVPVHGGNHHILEAKVVHGFCQMQRLFRVQRVGAAEAHITERAATGADVTHDHEGGGAATETLWQVGAGGFLADRMQLLLAQHRLDALDFAVGGNAYANPVRFTLVAGLFVDHGNGAYLVRATQLVADLNLALGLCLLAHGVSVTVRVPGCVGPAEIRRCHCTSRARALSVASGPDVWLITSPVAAPWCGDPAPRLAR